MTMPHLWLLYYACSMLNFRSVVSAGDQHVSEQCDWTDSGLVRSDQLESVGVRLIRPVYLRCSEGRVQWRYPGDALRLVLRLTTSGREFHGCFRLRWTRRSKWARIWLEVEDGVRLLYQPHDGRHAQLPRCFPSRNAQAVLLVQPIALHPPRPVPLIDFTYQLMDTRTHQGCVPCEAGQLLRLYCSCDYAARGRMLELRDNHQLERTEVRVWASRVYRQQTAKVFHTVETALDGHPRANVTIGTLHFALNCAVQLDSGEFMFLGRVLLASPRVMCAPRWEEWQRAAETQHKLCHIPHA